MGFFALFLLILSPFVLSEERLRGVVYLPDGSTPVPEAVIFSKKTGKKTKTDAKGFFELSTTLPDVLVVRKGIFSEEFRVEKDRVELVLPSRQEGRPKVAVITGSYDKLEGILSRMGIKFSLYDGNNSLDNEKFPNADALFTDGNGDGKPEIFNYDFLVINCGTSYEIEFLYDEEAKATLREFVERGGRLLVTDTSYDFVEQVFPEYIDFLGSEDTPPNEPEIMDAAEEGKGGIVVKGVVREPLLKDWLSTVPCYEGGKPVECIHRGKVRINGFVNGWAVIDGVHRGMENKVKVLVEGEVQWSGGKGVKPLTVLFEAGRGKVIFSSYHTKPHAPDTLPPQERILQYLLLQ